MLNTTQAHYLKFLVSDGTQAAKLPLFSYELPYGHISNNVFKPEEVNIRNHNSAKYSLNTMLELLPSSLHPIVGGHFLEKLSTSLVRIEHYGPHNQDDVAVRDDPITINAQRLLMTAVQSYTSPKRNPSLLRIDSFLEALQASGITPEKLDALQKVIDTHDARHKQITTLSTQSGLVFSYHLPSGEKVYCKIDTNINRIQKEYEYLTLIGHNPVAQCLSPRVHSMHLAQDAAALITYDTQTHKTSDAELKKLLSIITQRMLKYTNAKPNPHLLASALSHIAMHPYLSNKYFTQPDSRIILPFDELLERVAQPGNTALYNTLKAQQPLYTAALDQINQLVYEPTDVVVADLDARVENIFPSQLTPLPVRGDRALVEVTHPLFELAKLTASPQDVQHYALLRNILADEVGSDIPELSPTNLDITANQLSSLNRINTIRLASFKASVGRVQEAHSILTSL